MSTVDKYLHSKSQKALLSKKYRLTNKYNGSTQRQTEKNKKIDAMKAIVLTPWMISKQMNRYDCSFYVRW